MQNIRVLVIIGTTGVGKTKASIEIAKAFNGEIVNTDAMQMYTGLDIATAKATKEEQSGIPHHFLSILKPVDSWDVRYFQSKAIPVIEDISRRGKLPILVGGTMYYIQSLLWKEQLINSNSITSAEEEVNKSKMDKYQNASPSELYSELLKVDPVMAERLHPNNVRKVWRSLEVFVTTGKLHSKLIETQSKTFEKRFDAHAIWLQTEKQVLDSRLAKRVDSMLEQGLLCEIKKLWKTYLEHHPELHHSSSTCAGCSSSDFPVDCSRGVWQSIGFKEFIPYLRTLPSSSMLRDSSKMVVEDHSTIVDSEKGDSEILSECIAKLKIATNKYATKQTRWINNRFINRNIPVTVVDTSDVFQWSEHVTTPVNKVMEYFLEGKSFFNKEGVAAELDKIQILSLGTTDSPPDASSSSSLSSWMKYKCDVCNGLILDGELEWNVHLKSRRHRSTLRHLKKQREFSQWKEKQNRKNEKDENNHENITDNENNNNSYGNNSYSCSIL